MCLCSLFVCLFQKWKTPMHVSSVRLSSQKAAILIKLFQLNVYYDIGRPYLLLCCSVFAACFDAFAIGTGVRNHRTSNVSLTARPKSNYRLSASKTTPAIVELPRRSVR